MEPIFTNIFTVIEKFMGYLGTVTTSLLSNEIFQIILGMLELSIITGIIFYIISKISKIRKKNGDLLCDFFKSMSDNEEESYWNKSNKEKKKIWANYKKSRK